MPSRRRRLRRAALGFGLAAVAVLWPCSTQAQVRVAPVLRPAGSPPPDTASRKTSPADTGRRGGAGGASRDSTRRDTLGADTTARRDSVRRDTVAARFATADRPPSRDIGAPYRWSRDQVFASGALTLGELLERVPGAMTIRTGWITDLQATAYAGAFGRTRVFVDGVELDALDPKAGGVQDMGLLRLWPYEEVVVERAGDEVRVWLRTWQESRTNPMSRVDVLTGDREGNVFRGWFAKRWAGGLGLQATFSNASTRDFRSTQLGDGSLASYFLRLGWARGRFNVDATAERAGADRRSFDRRFSLGVTPADRPQLTVASLRAGYRSPDSTGTWAQVIVGSVGFRETPASSNLNSLAPSTDTTAKSLRSASQLQYVVAGGWNAGPLRAALTARVRAGDGRTTVSPMARLTWDPTSWVGATVTAERLAPDSMTRVDATVRGVAWSRLALVGSLANTTRTEAGRALATSSLRAEGAVRLRGALWVGGGVLRRDSTVAPGPRAFDTAYVVRGLAPATGTYALVRGSLWRDIRLDAWAMRWADADRAFYLPKVQARTQLYVESDWRSRFPKGHFGFHFGVIHEYRDPVRFPGRSGVQVTGITRNLSTLMEIRLLDAVISWRFNNTLRLDWDQAPGYVLPRGLNLYGVRWEFRG